MAPVGPVGPCAPGILWVPLVPERLLVRQAPVVLCPGQQPGNPPPGKLPPETRRYLGICYLSELSCRRHSCRCPSNHLPGIFRTWETIVAGQPPLPGKPLFPGYPHGLRCSILSFRFIPLGKLKYIITSPYFYCGKAALPPDVSSMCSK